MQEHCPTAEVVMTQYNINKGLHKFGYGGAVAVEKEVIQLLTTYTTKLYNPKDPTTEDQRASLG